MDSSRDRSLRSRVGGSAPNHPRPASRGNGSTRLLQRPARPRPPRPRSGRLVTMKQEIHQPHKSGKGMLGNPSAESQRDSVSKPRVARHELPWVKVGAIFNPNGVVSRRHEWAATPLGLFLRATISQGSSCLATLVCCFVFLFGVSQTGR